MPLSPQIEQNRDRPLPPVEVASTLVGSTAPSATMTEFQTTSSPKRATRSIAGGLLRILGFFCLVVILVFVLNAMINSGLRRLKTSQFGVSNKIVQGKINADIVITGSSRAVSHYDPRLIESATGHSAFNLGRNGSQTDMQLAVLKTYLKHNRKPEVIIQNLDAFSFVMTREVYDPAQYVPYLDEDDLYRALHQINPVVWRKNKYLPLYGYVVEDTRFSWILGLRGFFGWSPHEDCFLGFNPRAGHWTDDFENFKSAHLKGTRFEIEPAGVRVMDDLIQVCHDRGIKLIFVYSPEYREMQSLTQNRPEIFAKFRELSEQHQIPIWDFSDWAHSADTDFFRNSQHLNAEGAELFSRDLARRLAEELPHLMAKER
jgi:hypothetical protein